MEESLKKMFRFLAFLKEVDLIKTIIVRFKVCSRCRRLFPLLIHRNGKVALNKSAVIDIHSDALDFNCGARFNEPFPGLLEMMQNAQLIIEGRFKIFAGAHLIIGPNATLRLGNGHINRHAKIRCFNHIQIGNDVTISENVVMWDTDAHAVMREEYVKTAPIVIGDRVWIGTNVIILKGVTIGNNVVIGAGSVVNKNIPSNCLAAGNPAKVIRTNISWQ